MAEKLVSPGMQFILNSLAEARKRLVAMSRESRLRDIDEIWEAYCDIEQSIEVTKFVFKLHNRLEKTRKINASCRNDPTMISQEILVAKYESLSLLIDSANVAIREGNGEDAIELARKARDQLKLLLLGRAKSEQMSIRRKH